MARRGSSKWFSVEHENFIAYLLGGRRTKASGASPHDLGDVNAPPWLVECKMTGNPSEVSRKSKLVKDFEKIAVEAHKMGLNPMVAMRYFDPSSPIANNEGWVDLVVMTAQDAASNGVTA